MNTKLKELWEKVKDFFKNMSMKLRVILGVILVAIIAVIAAAYINSANHPYTALFSGLSNEEKNSIISYMEENGFTDYRVEGDSFLVPAEQEAALAARLLMAGYPKSGRMFDTYSEKVGALTTNAERDAYWLISNMQRMEAALRCIEGVRDAIVQIDLGQDQTYVLDDTSRTEPTASVTLTLEDGYMLDNAKAEAIRNMLVYSISGLKPENVGILDTIGNSYGSSAMSNFSDNSQLKLDLQQYYNNMIRTQIVQVLSGIYGKDNVRVAVTTEVDVNRRVMETKEYTQPEGSYENGGLIGKENVLWVITPDGVDAVGGVPGTSTNADIPLYLEDAIQGAGENAYAEYWTERDNKLNETSEQIEVASFTIVDASVAVTINENANTAANVNEEALRDHVAVASGIGGEDVASRVSILLAPFPVETLEPAPAGIISDEILPYLIIGAALLLVLLILIVTLMRVRSKRKKQREAEMAEIEEQLGEYGPIDMLDGMDRAAIGPDGQPVPSDAKANLPDVNTEKSMELRKMVRQFVQNNPEVAAQVIKSWVKGGEDGNG